MFSPHHVESGIHVVIDWYRDEGRQPLSNNDPSYLSVLTRETKPGRTFKVAVRSDIYLDVFLLYDEHVGLRVKKIELSGHTRQHRDVLERVRRSGDRGGRISVLNFGIGGFRRVEFERLQIFVGRLLVRTVIFL